MKIITTITLLLLLSCSNFNIDDKRSITRNPASVSEKFKSCLRVVNEIFTFSEDKKLLLALSNLKNNTLTSRSTNTLLESIEKIPYQREKEIIRKKLLDNEVLSHDEKRILSIFLSEVKSKPSNKDKYKKFYFGGDEGFPITYGLEFEMVIEENPLFLYAYRLKSVTQEKWSELSLEERISLAVKMRQEYDDVDMVFEKMPGASEHLPNELFKEAHGTIEGNGLIFDTIGELDDFISYFAEHFGRASFQGHAVHPDTRLEGIAGYTVFEHEKTQLEKLENGYRRYLETGSIPGKNLAHHSLGPIDQRVMNRLVNVEASFTDESIKIVDGTKMILGPYFRRGGPYGEGLMGTEFRQFHKNYEGLLKELQVYSTEIEVSGSLENYSKFSTSIKNSIESMRNVIASNELIEQNQSQVDDLELLFMGLGEVMAKRARQNGALLGGVDRDARLLLPFLDWRNHPVFDGLSENAYDELYKMIDESQLRYYNRLHSLIENMDLNNLSENDLDNVLIEISTWASESNLSFYYKRFKEGIKPLSRELKYYNLPKLSFFEQLREIEHAESAIPVYKAESGLSNNTSYNNYLNNTLEIIFSPKGSTGHVELRVGTKVYSFENHLLRKTFDYGPEYYRSVITEGSIGRVYQLNRDQLLELETYLNKIYRANENFPPFDVYGSYEKVEKIKEGVYKLVESRNKRSFNAKLVEDESGLYFIGESGLKVAAKRLGDDILIDTVNCAKISTLLVKSLFDIDLGIRNSAHVLNNAFLDFKVTDMPAAVIEY